MLNRNDKAFDTFYLTALDALAETVATWPGYARYAKKLTALRPHLLERGRLAFDAKPGHFHTLIHGDIWVNNTMYTYRRASDASNGNHANANNADDADDANDVEHSDDNRGGTLDVGESQQQRPDRMMLVDFQFCCWSSPTIDLHYFFNTSLREELRLHRQDELVQFYHGVLASTLAALDYGGYVPTLQAFHAELMQNSFYGKPHESPPSWIMILCNFMCMAIDNAFSHPIR